MNMKFYTKNESREFSQQTTNEAYELIGSSLEHEEEIWGHVKNVRGRKDRWTFITSRIVCKAFTHFTFSVVS